ncbi:MAG: FHA domain-containing protein [Planctomycetota bacterium]|nr:FHA domain-containing protein [Planctomycetota bacterium]RLS40823.1 MAG: FHA domain-containing protein [Planctomycetota bacterium]
MANSNKKAGDKPVPLGYLVLRQGNKPNQRFPLLVDRVLMGRATSATLRIPSAEVSRSHCLLVLRGGYWQVEDLGSSNGTFLNDKKVTGLAHAAPGDRIRLGRIEFLIEYQLQGDAARRLRQGQLLESLAGPGDSADMVELVDLDDMKSTLPPSDNRASSIHIEPDLMLNLDDLEMSLGSAYSIQPDEERNMPPPKPAPRVVSPSPIPELSWQAPPPLEDLRSLLSQLAPPGATPQDPGLNRPPRGKP